MEDSWRTHGGLMEDSWRTHGGFMEDSWRTHGGLMEDSWRTHGGLMEDSRVLYHHPTDSGHGAEHIGGVVQGNSGVLGREGEGSMKGE